MVGGCISLVTVESIARIADVQTVHQAVARHLGQNRRCGNGRTLAVAFYDPTLCHQERGNPEGIHQHRIGERRERENRALNWNSDGT